MIKARVDRRLKRTMWSLVCNQPKPGKTPLKTGASEDKQPPAPKAPTKAAEKEDARGGKEKKPKAKGKGNAKALDKSADKAGDKGTDNGPAGKVLSGGELRRSWRMSPKDASDGRKLC